MHARAMTAEAPRAAKRGRFRTTYMPAESLDGCRGAVRNPPGLARADACDYLGAKWCAGRCLGRAFVVPRWRVHISTTGFVLNTSDTSTWAKWRLPAFTSLSIVAWTTYIRRVYIRTWNSLINLPSANQSRWHAARETGRLQHYIDLIGTRW